MSYFFTVEGMDGVGKTKLIEELERRLVKKYCFEVYTTKEPTDTPLGEEIRQNINIYDTEHLSKLFLEDRKNHQKILKEKSKDFEIILCDRYIDSHICYQSNTYNDIEKLIHLNKDFIQPDKVFLIDSDVDTAIKRINKREDTSIQKGSIEYNHLYYELSRVKNNYDFLYKINPNHYYKTQYNNDTIIDSILEEMMAIMLHNKGEIKNG